MSKKPYHYLKNEREGGFLHRISSHTHSLSLDSSKRENSSEIGACLIDIRYLVEERKRYKNAIRQAPLNRILQKRLDRQFKESPWASSDEQTLLKVLLCIKDTFPNIDSLPSETLQQQLPGVGAIYKEVNLRLGFLNNRLTYKLRKIFSFTSINNTAFADNGTFERRWNAQDDYDELWNHLATHRNNPQTPPLELTLAEQLYKILKTHINLDEKLFGNILLRQQEALAEAVRLINDYLKQQHTAETKDGKLPSNSGLSSNVEKVCANILREYAKRQKLSSTASAEHPPEQVTDEPGTEEGSIISEQPAETPATESGTEETIAEQVAAAKPADASPAPEQEAPRQQANARINVPTAFVAAAALATQHGVDAIRNRLGIVRAKIKQTAIRFGELADKHPKSASLLIGMGTGFSVRMGAKFVLAAFVTTASVTTLSGFAATLATALVLGSLANGMARLAVTACLDKEKQKGWAGKAFYQGATSKWGLLGNVAGVAIADLCHADGFLRTFFEKHSISDLYHTAKEAVCSHLPDNESLINLWHQAKEFTTRLWPDHPDVASEPVSTTSTTTTIPPEISSPAPDSSATTTPPAAASVTPATVAQDATIADPKPPTPTEQPVAGINSTPSTDAVGAASSAVLPTDHFNFHDVLGEEHYAKLPSKLKHLIEAADTPGETAGAIQQIGSYYASHSTTTARHFLEEGTKYLETHEIRTRSALRAARDLAWMLFHGKGGPSDPARGCEIMQHLAELGLKSARKLATTWQSWNACPTPG